MRFLSILAAWCVLSVAACAQQGAAPAAGEKVDEKSATRIASYGIGMNMGRGLKEDGADIDLEQFIQGVRDGLQGGEPRFNDDQLRQAFEVFRTAMQAKSQARSQVAGDKNQKEGDAFLAKNKTQTGVTTLPSGLQYKVLKSGAGATPKAADTVKVHYEGTLLDGTVFDSSIKRKTPAEFPVNGVIPGWTEALQLMKVGDHWKLYIPANLAYGARGAGNGAIGPNSVLVFDVELLEVQPSAK